MLRAISSIFAPRWKMVNLSRFALMALGALLLAMSLSAAPAEDTTAVAGPPMAVNYAADGPVRIRFSSYLERKPLQDIRLLNLPPTTGRGKENLQQIARIDADEGMVYAPGETVTIHVK